MLNVEVIALAQTVAKSPEHKKAIFIGVTERPAEAWVCHRKMLFGARTCSKWLEKAG